MPNAVNESERPAGEIPGTAPAGASSAGPAGQHSGEGSASVLATLRLLENSRKQPERPADTDASAPDPDS